MKARWVWWLVTLAALAIAGGAAWYFFLRPAPAPAPATAVVVRGDVTDTVLATGILEASQLVSVGARVSGRIEKLHVALGQNVEAGQLIAEIDSLDQENALRSSGAAQASIAAQLDQQKAQLIKAQADLERAQGLREKDFISDANYEAVELALRTAEVQVRTLEAQAEQADLAVQSARLNLERTKITAPIAGTIVAVMVDEGQTVNAVQSSPTIVKIANLDEMVVKAEISEADVPRVHSGQRVSFTILGEPDNPISATLRSIEPAPESIRSESATQGTGTGTAVYYNGLFDVANPDKKLRISMTAEVTIVLEEARNVLVIPSSALGPRSPNGRFPVQVYDPGSGEITTQPVRVGLNDNVMAEIEEGLEEGQHVVVVGSSSNISRPGSTTGTGTGFGGGGRPPGM